MSSIEFSCRIYDLEDWEKFAIPQVAEGSVVLVSLWYPS